MPDRERVRVIWKALTHEDMIKLYLLMAWYFMGFMSGFCVGR